MPIYTYVKNADPNNTTKAILLRNGGLKLYIETYANLTSEEIAEIRASGKFILEEGIVPPAKNAGSTVANSGSTVILSWEPNVTYIKGQVVIYENSFYTSNILQSSEKFESKNWTLISNSLAEVTKPIFPDGVAYGLAMGGGNEGAISVADAKTGIESRVKWARTEINTPSSYNGGSPSAPVLFNERGLKVIGIIGNVPRGAEHINLSKYAEVSGNEPGLAKYVHTCIQQMEVNSPYCSIFECGNEMYEVGNGSPILPDPVSYGRMYVAVCNAAWAAGFRQPILFNMHGDYKTGASTFSFMVEGNGWLGDAIAGNTSDPIYSSNGEAPGSPENPKYGSLRQALQFNGFSLHPYNNLGTPAGGGSYMPGNPTSRTSGSGGGSYMVMNFAGTGIREQIPMKGSIINLLGYVPPIYLTEFGVESGTTEANLKDKANQIFACISGGTYTPSGENSGAAVTEIVGWNRLPFVRGIFPYVAYDKFNGHWGVIGSEPTSGTKYESWTKFREVAASYGT